MGTEIIEQLRKDIEVAVERKMRTPKDFEFLSERIFEKVHQHISSTTLKRLWGYLPGNVTPRPSSLDLLAQFLDYEDWEAYSDHLAAKAPQEATTPLEPIPTNGKGKPRPSIIILSLVALSILVGLAFHHWLTRDKSQAGTANYAIHQGDRFATYGDYLQLFGIYEAGEPWGAPLPHHPNIIIWGPEYQHPHWHNEGDTSQMFPTIKEYYTPLQDSSEISKRLMGTLNEQRYHAALRFNELRITFMKNLKDTDFVFLGVYRLNKEKSDTASIMWERVADKVDLNNLNYLEQLRN